MRAPGKFENPAMVEDRSSLLRAGPALRTAAIAA